MIHTIAKHKINLSRTFFILLLIIFSGCAKYSYNIDSSLNIEDIALLSLENTPEICSYKGKASVIIEGDENASFTILLNKKCNDDALISILGAFNSPVVTIKYENGIIDVEANNQENAEYVKDIADKFIFYVIGFFKSPKSIPDIYNYKIYYNNSSYIFKDKFNNEIYADDKFRLYKYIENSTISEYIWDDENILKSIIVDRKEMKVTVKFLNKNGWSKEDGDSR